MFPETVGDAAQGLSLATSALPRPRPHLDSFEHFGEGYSRALVDHGDVGGCVGDEDADGPSRAWEEESSQVPQHPAVCAGLAGGVGDCLLSGGVLISGHARQLPENKECRHPPAFTFRLRIVLTSCTLMWRGAIGYRESYVVGVRIFSCMRVLVRAAT
jgi:hypothetical protein